MQSSRVSRPCSPPVLWCLMLDTGTPSLQEFKVFTQVTVCRYFSVVPKRTISTELLVLVPGSYTTQHLRYYYLPHTSNLLISTRQNLKASQRVYFEWVYNHVKGWPLNTMCQKLPTDLVHSARPFLMCRHVCKEVLVP